MIIGVTPRDFFGVEVGRSFDVVLPIGAEPLIRGTSTALDVRLAVWLRVMVRLKADQSPDTAAVTLRRKQPQIREAAMPHEFSHFPQDSL